MKVREPYFLKKLFLKQKRLRSIPVGNNPRPDLADKMQIIATIFKQLNAFKTNPAQPVSRDGNVDTLKQDEFEPIQNVFNSFFTLKEKLVEELNSQKQYIETQINSVKDLAHQLNEQVTDNTGNAKLAMALQNMVLNHLDTIEQVVSKKIIPKLVPHKSRRTYHHGPTVLHKPINIPESTDTHEPVAIHEPTVIPEAIDIHEFTNNHEPIDIHSYTDIHESIDIHESTEIPESIELEVV
jgi:uncharacterized protein YoxC